MAAKGHPILGSWISPNGGGETALPGQFQPLGLRPSPLLSQSASSLYPGILLGPRLQLAPLTASTSLTSKLVSSPASLDQEKQAMSRST